MEFLQLPETKPTCEYFDERIIQKPMPQGKHSVIQGELVSAINRVVKPQHIARAFPELRCTFGDQSVVPDVAVFIWDRIPRDDRGEVANTFSVAPDWTVEILSPGQSQTKVVKKILHCLHDATELGWLIDPDEQTVFIYQPKCEPVVHDQLDQVLVMPAFAQTLQLTLGELFAWLRD